MPSNNDKSYGLLGFPLGHSFSKTYFAERLNYENFEFPTVEEFLCAKPANLAGFNVTIPHKQNIIPHLNNISNEARQIGAVNCVKIIDEKLCGFNTDCYGFEISLLEMLGGKKPNAALVLGYGGAAKAVCYVLEKLAINYKIVSRQTELNYKNLSPEIIATHQLIINTTPLGMIPNIDTLPDICYNEITAKHYLYDLVYNPSETAFMRSGRKQGATIINGLKMLRLQAEKSFDIWTL